MDDPARAGIIKAGWEIHAVVEEAAIGSSNQLERRRLLLADMAIHLLQTAIAPGEIELNKLKNNLHAILTLADPFLPHAELKKAFREDVNPLTNVC